MNTLPAGSLLAAWLLLPHPSQLSTPALRALPPRTLPPLRRTCTLPSPPQHAYTAHPPLICPQVTVILKHVFTPDELIENPLLREELEGDIREECGKLGKVDKVGGWCVCVW